MSEERELSGLELLREIIELMEERDLSEVRLSEGDIKIRVKRQGDELIPLVQHSTAPSQIAEQALSQPQALSTESNPEQADVIRAPMLGTFYRSPEPDQPAFVETGSNVAVGDTLCMIEAMKVFTDMKAEFECEIVAVLVEDSQPVEHGQPLFRVRRF